MKNQLWFICKLIIEKDFLNTFLLEIQKQNPEKYFKLTLQENL